MGDGTPQNNVHRLVPRTTYGRGGRVGVRVTGLDIADNNSPQRVQYPITNERRDEIIRFHVSMVNALRVQKGMPALVGGELDKIIAAGQHAQNPSSESIMQAVLSAATAAAPSNAQDAFKNDLLARGIDEASYYAAIARFGSSLGSLDAVINAARSIKAGGSGYEASSGNMSNGVGNTGTGTYPDYGGTSFRSYGVAASYGYSTHGLNGGTTQQLWNLGVRSERQMQQVVSDVGRIGLGAGKENPQFTNRVAPHVARLRIAEGERTNQHLDQARRHTEEYRRIKEDRMKAEARGDAAGMADADRRMAELRQGTEQYRHKEVRTPEGRAAHSGTITESEAEVRRQLQQQYGNHPSLRSDHDANAAARARVGQGQEQARSAAVVAGVTSPTGDAPAPAGTVKEKVAAEINRQAGLAIDDFGGAQTPAAPTVKAEAPAAGAPVQTAAAPVASPAATVVASAPAAAPAPAPAPAAGTTNATPNTTAAATPAAAAPNTKVVAAPKPGGLG